MSTTESVVEENDITEDDALEIGAPISPYRRALELAALATSLTALVLAFSFVGQTYTAVNAQSGADPTTTQILRFLTGLLLQPVVSLLALLAIALAAIVRSIWPGERSASRTVIPATIAIVVAFVVGVAAIYDIVMTFPDGSAQYGETTSAKLTGILTDLASLLLALGVLAIGFVFASSRAKSEDSDEDPDAVEGSPVGSDSPDTVVASGDADTVAAEGEAGSDTHYKA